MSRVWDLPCENHTQKLVLLAIADNANDEGECWPSMETLARKCNLSDQAVRNWVQFMEREGWLSVDRGHNLKRSNYYKITLPQPPTPLTPNAVDPQPGLPQPPTPFTPTPNAVDPNHKEPSTKRQIKALPPIPTSLDVPKFRKAWEEWLTYRRSKRKPVSDIAASKQFKDLAEWGVDAAVESINYSIKRDYQGLFPPKDSGPKSSGRNEVEEELAGTVL